MSNKFSLKKYNKDRNKCYEMSKSGINLDTLSKTEERISTQRIRTIINANRAANASELSTEADKCNKKDALALCRLPVKDRKMDKCQFCETNV